ncbi:MAG: hypothetical protein KGD64_14505 [Candidatus Heimdallarchaeota archaeon]|nr:hypothetical protein [Candidatus Heimdallarchaeota archaeon]
MVKKILVGVIGFIVILAVSIPTIIYFTGDKQLSLVSSFNIGDLSATSGIVTDGKYVYIADARDGLLIIDISNPNEPILTGYYNSSLAESVTVNDGIAYIADAFDGLVVVNVTDPTAPTLLAELPLGNSRGVFLRESLLYVVDGTVPFKIFNISNPESPQVVGSLDISSWVDGLDIEGNYAYLATRQRGMVVVDIEDPTSLSIVGELSSEGDIVFSSVRRIKVEGDCAYLAASYSGLIILNISDPYHPTHISNYDVQYAYSVHISDNLVYLSADKEGLHVLDISDPSNLVLFDIYATEGVHDICTFDSLVYTHCETSLKIFKWDWSF